MKIIDKGIIYSGAENTRHAILSFPSLVQLASGKILASFQAASRKNAIDTHILLSQSLDGGKTWKEPFEPFSPGKDVIHVAYLSEVKPGRLMANLLWCNHFGDSSLEFFNPDTSGIFQVAWERTSYRGDNWY